MENFNESEVMIEPPKTAVESAKAAKKPESKVVRKRKEKPAVAGVLEKKIQKSRSAGVESPKPVKERRPRKVVNPEPEKAKSFVEAENVRAELERLTAQGKNPIEKLADVNVVEEVESASSRRETGAEASPREALELQSFFENEKNEMKPEKKAVWNWDRIVGAVRNISSKISSRISEIIDKN